MNNNNINIKRRGLMLILDALPGVGKTSIFHNVLKQEQNIHFSVSYTTRPKRPSETDGKDYHFITKNKFEDMVKKDLFLEYALVWGKDYYGTPRTEI